MLVGWLIVFCLMSKSKNITVHSYVDITIISENKTVKFKHKYYAGASAGIYGSRETFLSCHTCRNMGQGFCSLIQGPSQFSHLDWEASSTF